MCADCLARAVAQARASDTLVARQRILDRALGEVGGAQLVLAFIAPARTHFDLGYALIGPYSEIGDTVGYEGNSQPTLHGPWNATDAAGNAYRGLGNGGQFQSGLANGTIRFIPEIDGPPWPLRPAPGLLKLEALNAGRVLVTADVEVPAPAAWEMS